MEIFALFLPQFHEIAENNEWWGNGFTEWKNVQKATALFKGHLQPRHPLNDNYYNLLDKKTVAWQTELMKKYEIDGLIYYHYYFNGKLLLEKPAENLLKWKDLDQKFFFNWANHSWIRSWKGTKELLIEQTYGNVDDWKKHFEYLLPFFNDSRYKKIDNKPLMIIYDVNFPEKDEMFSCFDKWCVENGFNGLFLIEECFSPLTNHFKNFDKGERLITRKMYLTLPLAGRTLLTHDQSSIKRLLRKTIEKLNQRGVVRHITKYEGDEILWKMMNKQYLSKHIIPGLFFEWDNTPRHGNRGYIISPITEKAFYTYMDFYKNVDIMIVNAWNEWCEGMILEPTEEDGYKYLEWIKNWKKRNE